MSAEAAAIHDFLAAASARLRRRRQVELLSRGLLGGLCGAELGLIAAQAELPLLGVSLVGAGLAFLGSMGLQAIRMPLGSDSETAHILDRVAAHGALFESAQAVVSGPFAGLLQAQARCRLESFSLPGQIHLRPPRSFAVGLALALLFALLLLAEDNPERALRRQDRGRARPANSGSGAGAVRVAAPLPGDLARLFVGLDGSDTPFAEVEVPTTSEPIAPTQRAGANTAVPGQEPPGPSGAVPSPTPPRPPTEPTAQPTATPKGSMMSGGSTRAENGVDSGAEPTTDAHEPGGVGGAGRPRGKPSAGAVGLGSTTPGEGGTENAGLVFEGVLKGGPHEAALRGLSWRARETLRRYSEELRRGQAIKAPR